MGAVELLNRCSVPRFFRSWHHKRILVLMYHGVLPDDDPLAIDDWLQVRASEFAEQMAFLREHYQPVRLIDAIEGQPRPSGKPVAIVTFDDGYANNFHHALPVLQQFNIPATIFVATSHIGRQKLFWWDRMRLSMQAHAKTVPSEWPQKLKRLPPSEIDDTLDQLLASANISSELASQSAPDSYRAMTVGELQQAKMSGLIDFGSHTHGHEIIERLSDSELRDTLREAREHLNQWGMDAKLFAAPNGDYLDRQIPIFEEQGLKACVATTEGLWLPGETSYRIPRMGIGRDTSIEKFALITSGVMHFIHRFKPMHSQHTY